MEYNLSPSYGNSPELFKAMRATGMWRFSPITTLATDFEFLKGIRYVSNNVDNVVTLFVEVKFNVEVSSYPNKICSWFGINKQVEKVSVQGFVSERDLYPIVEFKTTTMECS